MMMGENPTVDETKRKLGELGKRIRAAKSSLGAHHEIASDAAKAWDDMIETHAEITRRLEQAKSPSSDFLEGLRFDVDILNHTFERWMARVESGFDEESRGR
jgi:hypothetical protein